MVTEPPIKDYRLTVRIRNNRILRAIERCGYPSVAAFCRHHKINYQYVHDLIAIRRSPLKHDGDWTESVERLSSILGVAPEQLFNARQIEGAIAKTTIVREVSEEEIIPLTSEVAQRLTDQRTDPGQSLENKELVQKLLSRLPPRYERVARLYYGIGGDAPLNGTEIAEQLKMSRARVDQMISKAERLMRSAAVRHYRVMSPRNKAFREDEENRIAAMGPSYAHYR